MNASAKSEPIVIKKYANRRLYDTETSAYITLEDMCERVKEGRDFIVVDAKTGQDLTQQVLSQIILESALDGHPLLPVEFLRSVITFYDDKMSGVMQHYLNASMKAFITNQDKMRGAMNKNTSSAGGSPFKPFEDMARQNVALFEKTMGMFSPFSMFGDGQKSEEEPSETRRKQRRN